MKRSTALLAFILTPIALLAADALTPLKIEFPPPMITGTPVPVKLPNLEAPNTPPPEVLVPAGVTNLAKGKTVTGSDSAPVIGDLNLITDGDKSSDEGSFVEFEKGLQWVQIDLGARAELYAVALWHFHSQLRAYHDVIVQISNDPEFKEGVATIFNNDYDNSSKLGAGKDPSYIETNKGRLIPARKTVGRYVRLYSNGSTSNPFNHYIEVEVYGLPAK
ncbi:MAG: discoidin domain-containing protein [Opitutaceae bacterium]|jgi:hypothetical protein